MIERGSRTMRVTTPNGVSVADHVIVAMAPPMTAQILFDPVLPVPRNQSVQRAGMGDTIKAFAVYPTPFWRMRGYNGAIQSNSTVFNAAFDNTPARPGAPGVLLALVENNAARRVGALPKAQRQREVTSGFAKAFGSRALHPTMYVDQDWGAEPWIRGGAAATFPPGLLTEYRYLFDKPIGGLHFAGTETATRWWGNIEAAFESGERAAGEVLRS